MGASYSLSPGFADSHADRGCLRGAQDNLIFLLWLWISNLALLVGAEVNDVLQKDRERRGAGGDRSADRPAARG